MRRRVTGVFGALVVAFLALTILLASSLWPQLRSAEALRNRYAANSTRIAEMTAALEVVRSAAIQASLQLQTRLGPRHPAPGSEELERARRALGTAMAEYEKAPMGPAETQLWQRLSNELFPAFDQAVDGMLSRAALGASLDGEAVTFLRAATLEANATLQRLARTNAQELDVTGKEIHFAVAKLVLVCLALGVIGTLGGLALAWWALIAVNEYERTTGERLAELDEFAGRVAHDLRNPLQAMSMSLVLIHRRTDDETRATVEKAQGSVRRMAAFIEELLQFARSGAKPAAGASARVEEVLRSVEQDLAALAADKNVAVLVRSSGSPRAAITPEALRAIIGNLADNAVKHMSQEPGKVRQVELIAEDGEREVRILVRDSGTGIAPEAVPHLFEPFFRATTRPGGFGIGLKTVKRLVDAHRGRISVDSEQGNGSVFTVTLPSAPPPIAPARPEPRPPHDDHVLGDPTDS